MAKQKLIQKQYQKLSPNQIQFLGLLQAPITSLEKRIKEEIEENPVIEEDEEVEEGLRSSPPDVATQEGALAAVAADRRLTALGAVGAHRGNNLPKRAPRRRACVLVKRTASAGYPW